MLLTPAQIKRKSFESRRNSFFLPGVDASHVYVRAWALGCFHSHIFFFISTQPFRRALAASVDSCAEMKWRNQIWQSLEEGAGKRCSECGYAVQKLRQTVQCDGLNNHLDTQGRAKRGQNIKLCCADTKETARGHKGKDVKQLSPGARSTGHYLLVRSQGHPLPFTGRRE